MIGGRVTRRRVLLGLGAVGAVAGGYALFGPEGAARFGVFRDLDAARLIGRRHFDAGADLAAIEAWLPSLDGMTAESRGQAVRTRIRDDFERGDVVLIDRWCVARSEADLCAWMVRHG